MTFPVWLQGAPYFFFWTTGKRFRVPSWAFVTVRVVLIAAHGKDYYAPPAYPMVFAGGQSLSSRCRPGNEWDG